VKIGEAGRTRKWDFELRSKYSKREACQGRWRGNDDLKQGHKGQTRFKPGKGGKKYHQEDL